MFKKYLLRKPSTVLAILLFLLVSSDILAQKNISSDNWIKVLADLEKYYIVIDNDFGNAVLINRGDSLSVEPGTRNITIVWQSINDVSFRVFIDSTVTTTDRRVIVSRTLNPKSSFETIISKSNLQVVSDPGSSIYIDGEKVGEHYIQTLIKPGNRELRIVHPEHGELKTNIDVNTVNVTKVSRYNKNPSNLSFGFKLLPGAEYFATGRKGKGTISVLAISALTVALISKNKAYSTKSDEYSEWFNLYQSTTNSIEAISYRNNAIDVQSDLDKMAKKFNRTLMITTGIYVLATIDSFRKPKDGYKGKFILPQGADISVNSGVYNTKLFPELSFKYHFK